MDHDEQEIDSEELDLVTVFESAGTSSEMEALQVQALLQSNGIDAVLIGDTRLPNIPEAVRVAREDADRAQQLISRCSGSGSGGSSGGGGGWGDVTAHQLAAEAGSAFCK